MDTLLIRGLRPVVAPAVLGACIIASLVAAPMASARAQDAPRINPAWLSADSASRTAQFDLVAGLSPVNAGMNFNGFGNGHLKLTVPVGWQIVMHFRNMDQNLPHSAVVIRAVTPIPAVAGPPAFAHAGTHHLSDGMPTGAKEDVRFTADQAGSYMFFCAVPGHGSAGMWIGLDVSPTATMPAMAVVH